MSVQLATIESCQQLSTIMSADYNRILADKDVLRDKEVTQLKQRQQRGRGGGGGFNATTVSA